ncbi:MAG: TetR/AcrR family transcriptional regulator [Epsilonproteobacteria bacterium]|nr:TetR/AcrR family transcriptional regulator [Campylobacterota bacterium]
MGKDINKKKRILEAATTVIAQKGYHGTKVSDIAKLAEVADGTIYLYFKNKDNILLTILSDALRDLNKKLIYQLNNINDIENKIKKIIDNHMKFISQNDSLAQVLQIELRSCSTFMRGGIFPELRNYLKIIEEVISYGARTGQIEEDVDIKIAAKALFGMLDELSTIWVLRKKHAINKMAKTVFEIFCRGIIKNASINP